MMHGLVHRFEGCDVQRTLRAVVTEFVDAATCEARVAAMRAAPHTGRRDRGSRPPKEVVMPRRLSRALVVVTVVACADRAPSSSPFLASPPSTAPAVAAVRAPVAVDRTSSELDDADPEAHLRDPFHVDPSVFIDPAPTDPAQPSDVVVGDVPVAQLRLEALVRLDREHRAMVVGPNGVGFTLRRGDYVGKAETMSRADGRRGATRTHWRVDRITDADVVLALENIATPDAPRAYRVLALHAPS
jgi:hypothetical protein